MRYHFKKPDVYLVLYGEDYICNHPYYNRCTLYKEGDKGVAVVELYYNEVEKHFYYDRIQPYLNNELYLSDRFSSFFKEYAKTPVNGLFPTFELRKLMWHLRLKPIKKEPFEAQIFHKL